jgi:hypothetical protein
MNKKEIPGKTIDEEQLSSQISPEDIAIPEIGMFFNPEEYKVLDIVDGLIRRKGMLSQPQKVAAALMIPKVPGTGDSYSGFQMHLHELVGGELKADEGNYTELFNRGPQGLSVTTNGGVITIDLFGGYEAGLKFYRDSGYSPRIDALQKVVGKYLWDIHRAIELSNQDQIETAALAIAPQLARFLDIFPDVITPFYLKMRAGDHWRNLKYRSA